MFKKFFTTLILLMIFCVGNFSSATVKAQTVDLAVYCSNISEENILQHGEFLIQHGYTYNFVSPEMLEKFSVKNNRLDFDGTTYKALVLSHQETLTPAAEDKLFEIAKTGLPIIVIGKAPNHYDIEGDYIYLKKLGEIMPLPAVTQIRNTEKNPEKILKTLQSIGITPDLKSIQ